MEAQMKTSLKIEELFMFGLSIYMFSQMDYSWWWYPALLFTPDLSMIGYLANARIGSITYNFIHHKALGITLYILGLIGTIPALQLAGVMLFSHSNMDRILGYGLKYPDSFQHTHLGMIGRSS
jgi:hypothetical protein